MMNICFKNQLKKCPQISKNRIKNVEAQSYMSYVKIFLKTVKKGLLRAVNWSKNRKKEVTDGRAFNLYVHLFKMVFYSNWQNSNIHY